MKLLLLIISVLASEKKENVAGKSEPNVLENSAQNEILVKIEEDEYTKLNNQNYVGVSYYKNTSTWCARRWSKKESKAVCNGTYKDEETAAHASDTLARKLIEIGEEDHKLNFPDDDTEVYLEKKTSNYIGLSYNKKDATWRAQRWSKNERKQVLNGTSYKNEETAAHASDTLARKLIANGEKDHKFNFPDDDTEVYSEKTSQYIGVIYNHQKTRWRAERWSKNENKRFYNGAAYKDEETAAHASDTLARKLIANGEKGHKLNFPDDAEVYPENQTNKRKRPADFEEYQKRGKSLDKFE